MSKVSDHKQSVALQSLAAKLAAAGPYGVFARHLLRRAPEAPALLAPSGAAFAVSGAPVGHFEVSFAWLFADTASDYAALIDLVVRGYDMPAYLPLSAHAEITNAIRGLSVGRDLFFALPASANSQENRKNGGDRIVPFGEADRLRLPEDMRDLPPPPDIWARMQPRFWALQRDGRLIALAEATVDDGAYAAIQQVHVAEEARRSGAGAALVSAIAAELRALRRTPIYICAADNRGSAALAGSVGFEVISELCCVAPSEQTTDADSADYC
ncbi:MAG: GNAT family N-acetyltransferase [Neomegalonema sp.]|nr:GNAT family N-acetyltransferase [Neomegalonema sp.]